MEINKLSVLIGAIWAYFIIFVSLYFLNPSASTLQSCALILSGSLVLVFSIAFIKTDEKIKMNDKAIDYLLTISGGVLMIAGILFLSFVNVKYIGWILLILSFIPNILVVSRSRNNA